MGENDLQDNAEKLRAILQSVLENAKTDEVSTPFENDVPMSVMDNVSRPSSTPSKPKKLLGIKTDTFLDNLFLSDDGKVLGGLPSVSNTILTGLPSSGKSLFINELLIRLAQNYKVVFVTSEDMWATTSDRMDLQTRIMEKAKKLGIEWDKIFTNIYILDTIEHTELREWVNFITTYRRLVEQEQATILLVDSLTLLEDNRGALKRRLLELMRYNQRKGVTSVLINQRSVEEADNLAMAGGLALSHIVDTVMIMDYKKPSSWDSQLKMDIPEAKQGQLINFFRILKCRLCRFNGKYFGYEITDDGIVKFNKVEDIISTEEK